MFFVVLGAAAAVFRMSAGCCLTLELSRVGDAQYLALYPAPSLENLAKRLDCLGISSITWYLEKGLSLLGTKQVRFLCTYDYFVFCYFVDGVIV